jgi:RNAse (barnase) inhibitor barstar
MKTNLSWPPLLKRSLPWSHFMPVPRLQLDEFLRTVPAQKRAAVRLIQGRACGTRDAMLDELARALDFPEYFGSNWDALEDCLTDLAWLSSNKFVFVVTNTDALLRDERAMVTNLGDILKEAAAFWQDHDPPAAFHVLFHCEPEHADDVRELLEESGIALQ